MNLDDSHIRSLITESHKALDEDDGIAIRLLGAELLNERRRNSKLKTWLAVFMLLCVVISVVSVVLSGVVFARSF